MPKPVQTAKLTTIQPRQPERRLTPSIQQAPQQFPVVSPDQQRFRLGPEYQEMPDEDVPDLDLLTAELDDLAALAEKAVEKRMGFGREPRIEGKPLIEKPLRR